MDPQYFAPDSEKKGVVELLRAYQHTHSYSAENEGRTPYGVLPSGGRECDEDLNYQDVDLCLSGSGD